MKRLKYKLLSKEGDVKHILQIKTIYKCKKLFGFKIPYKIVLKEKLKMAVLKTITNNKPHWYKVKKDKNNYYHLVKELKNKRLIKYLNKN